MQYFFLSSNFISTCKSFSTPFEINVEKLISKPSDFSRSYSIDFECAFRCALWWWYDHIWKGKRAVLDSAIRDEVLTPSRAALRGGARGGLEQRAAPAVRAAQRPLHTERLKGGLRDLRRAGRTLGSLSCFSSWNDVACCCSSFEVPGDACIWK